MWVCGCSVLFSSQAMKQENWHQPQDLDSNRILAIMIFYSRSVTVTKIVPSRVSLSSVELLKQSSDNRNSLLIRFTKIVEIGRAHV